MPIFLLKVVISALVIATVSEVAKRSVLAASVLASLPISSLIALSFLQYETQDSSRVASLSQGIFWGVLPSLLFLAVLPWLLRSGYRFAPAMAISCAVMIAAYAGYLYVLDRAGIRL
jgi:hypothetical protein